MSGDFTLRACVDGDLAAVGLLFEQVGARTAHSADFLRWHFRPAWKDAAAPYNLDLVTNAAGEVVSCYGSVETPLLFFGGARHFGWSANFLTREDCRGYGLGGATFLAHIRRYEMYAAFSPNELSRPLMDICKFIPFSEQSFQRFLYPCDRERLAAMCPAGAVRDAIAAALPGRRPLRVACDDVAVLELTAFGEDYLRFWNSCKGQFQVTTDRQPAYMDWRYRQIPYFRYHVSAAYRSGTMTAVAIWRIDEDGGVRVARMCDFIAQPDQALPALCALVTEIASHEVTFVDFFKTGPLYDDALERAGFLPLSGPLEQIPTLFSPLSNRRWRNSVHVWERRTGAHTEQLRSIDSYYFTKGDADRDFPTEYYRSKLAAQQTA